MLRFLGLIPCLLVFAVGCDDGTLSSGCLEDVEPRAACQSFDVTSRRCESLLPIEFLPVALDERCECQLQSVTDFPDCEAQWETLHACLGDLSCEDYIAFANAEEDAPCADEVERTSELCVDENGNPIFN
ncbi:MAG: hypothetical protein AAGF92_08245 [Myxococcota bacterium]